MRGTKDFVPDEGVEADLREIAHYYGGWKELRGVIDRLEEWDAEDAAERYFNEPGALGWGFRG